MAWETRGNGSYFYKSERVGGRVVKQYLGGGTAGMLASELDAEWRREARAHLARQRAERERWAALERLADEQSKLADVLMGAALADAGFRRHDRGEWRRRRVEGNDGDR